jgi:hypothetical protein
MEPAFTVPPPETLTPRYWGFESRPFFAPLPPRLRAISLPPLYLYLTKIRVFTGNGKEPFRKKSSGGGQEFPAFRGTFRFHPENTPF